MENHTVNLVGNAAGNLAGNLMGNLLGNAAGNLVGNSMGQGEGGKSLFNKGSDWWKFCIWNRVMGSHLA